MLLLCWLFPACFLHVSCMFPACFLHVSCSFPFLLFRDPSGDSLKPVLLVGPDSRRPKKAVRSVLVLTALGVLAVGLASGKVRRQ
jgi:hypothetical protein